MSLLIAHIVYSFKIGGLENGMVNLINRLPRDRYRHVIIALTDADPSFCKRIQRDDVEVIELHKPPGQGFKLFPKVFRVLRRLRPDIVHTRNLAALEMSFPAWIAGIRCRIHGEHGRDVDDPDGSNKTQQWIRRIYQTFIKHYVALSKDLEAYLTDTIGIADSRVSLVCNGVDAQRFSPSPTGRIALPESPFNAPELFVFGTVGRLQAVKDQIGLLRAFALLLKSSSSERARLMIVGDGPLRADLEAIAKAEGISEQVWFVGERSDVANTMRAMNCFVLPSLAEGISNTVLEAMASGLPVIATRVGGNPELVDVKSGKLVPPSMPQALAQAMADYLREPEQAIAAGRAGRARIEAEFSLDAMVEKYDALYQRLIK